MSKVLIACFSPTGHTLKVAETIHSNIASELFVIRPEQPYTSADLDWNNQNSRSTLEMKDPACRPAIADKVTDMERYKTIFLGFPVWWYEAPRIILTFLDSYNLAGTECVPFATSGGSGLGKIPALLEAAAPSVHWLPGKVFPSGVSRQVVEEWLKSERRLLE